MKTALIVGGAAIGLLLVWKLAQASSAGTSSGTVGTSSTTGGTTTTSGVAPVVTPTGSTSILNSTIGGIKVTTIGKVVAAPVYYPTEAVIKGAKWVGNLF